MGRDLRVGDWVEVRSEREILESLDEFGQYEHVPFMPQMVSCSGKRFRVSKRAHKLCDTVNGTGARALKDAVFLDDLRCDGVAYGGCEMGCLLLWKDVWLKRVDPSAGADAQPDAPRTQRPDAARLFDLAARNASVQGPGGDEGPAYRCQATQMPYATIRLSVWSPRQYVEDFRSGNARLGEILGALLFLLVEHVASSGIGIGSFLRWCYERVQQFRGGPQSYPCRPGKLGRSSRTPSAHLNLSVGEVVWVKAHDQILQTVNEEFANRGMQFHPEMVPYCSRSFRVTKRVRRLMNEKNGQVMELKNECLVLEGASCVGRYTKPLLCPRGMPPYWREIWLERAQPAGASESAEPLDAASYAQTARRS